MKSNLIAIGLSVVAIVIAAATFIGHAPLPGNTTQSFWDSKLGYRVNGVQIFNSSGVLTGASTGTCSLIAASYTVAASTTVSMDCAISGILSGDILMAGFATSTVAGNGWAITGASASTTSGYGTLRVTNWTGASAVIPASIASSTDYFISR